MKINNILNSKLNTILQQSLNWVIPEKCIDCNRAIKSNDTCICDICYPKLPFLDNACQHCGQPFNADADICGRCIKSSPIYDQCFYAFKYEYPIDKQICQFKYSERPELAKPIAKLLYHEIKQHYLPTPELLIPVPVHTRKLRERGFNQSLLLTKILSSLTGIPYANSIDKYRHTSPQAQQTLKQRHNNIKNSFRLNTKINAKHVAIIDDVITTGATVSEISKILQKNGVDYIQVWGVAHTLQS